MIGVMNNLLSSREFSANNLRKNINASELSVEKASAVTTSRNHVKFFKVET
jgi:hypothetical protein